MAVKVNPILSATLDITGTISDSTGNVTVGDNLDVTGNLAVTGTLSVGTTISDTDGTLELKGNMADGASAVAIELDSGVALANSSAKMVSIRNNNSEHWYFMPTYGGSYKALVGNSGSGDAVALFYSSNNGYLTLGGSSELTISNSAGFITNRGKFRNDSGAVTLVGGSESGNVTSVKIWPYSGTTTSATKLVQVYKNQGTTEVFGIDGVGTPRMSVTTDAVAGDSATINAPAGSFVKDTSGTTFTLTNSLVSTTTLPFYTVISAPGDTSYIVSCVPTANTLTFTWSAAPTANTTVAFHIINPV